MGLDLPIPTVIVVGRDTIVGQILELLLRSADCNVRFVSELSLNDPGLLDEVQLLLLAPGLSTERHEAFSALVDSRSSAAKIPILELINDDREARAGRFAVPWPCRAEELKRRIKSALLAGSGPGQDDDYPSPKKGKEAVGG